MTEMYQTSREYLEDEFYTQLTLTCQGCGVVYSPMELPGWESTGNDELDASKMKEEYTPKVLMLGWTTNNHGDALCPECASKNT